MRKSLGRREFIKGFAMFGSFCGMAAASVCCDSPAPSSNAEEQAPTTDPCEDFSGVSENDLQIRKQAAYVMRSPQPGKTCDNCNLYLPPSKGKDCGGCMLFKGPVVAGGYCVYWAPTAS